MGLAIRQVEFTTLYYCAAGEWSIVEKYFHESEDGTFYVDEEILKEAIADAKKDGVAIPEDVILALRKAMEKDDFGGINFVLS